MKELQNAKKQISEGEAPRDDSIMPEIDDIILFANKLLIIVEKQNQFAILNLKPNSQIWQIKWHWKLQRYQLNIGSRQAE